MGRAPWLQHRLQSLSGASHSGCGRLPAGLIPFLPPSTGQRFLISPFPHACIPPRQRSQAPRLARRTRQESGFQGSFHRCGTILALGLPRPGPKAARAAQREERADGLHAVAVKACSSSKTTKPVEAQVTMLMPRSITSLFSTAQPLPLIGVSSF